MDDLYGAPFGGAGDGASGGEVIEEVADMVAPVGGESGGDAGADLEEVFVSGLHAVDVAKPLHPDMGADDTEVVAHQIDDHDVLGHLFGIREDRLGRMGQMGIDGAFHGVGGDGVSLDLDEALRGKAGEKPRDVELEFRPGVAENLFEAQIGLDGGLAGEVEQVGVAGADLLEDTVQFGFVSGKRGRMFGKYVCSFPLAYRIVAPIFEFVEDTVVCNFIERLSIDFCFIKREGKQKRRAQATDRDG